MKLKWKTLSSRQIYKNPWMEVQEDKVLRPDGKEGIYGFIKKLPGVFVIALDKDDSIYFIREYRYIPKKTILQLPVGTVDGKSPPIENAKRELFEETGIRAKKWTMLGGSYTAPGHETTYYYTILAEDLDTSQSSQINQDGDESIEEVLKIPIKKLKNIIKSGELEDGPSLAALNIFFQKFNK